MNAPIVPTADVVHALLDNAAPSNDPVVQFVQNALSGFGYDLYDPKLAARANDRLVREKASGLLGDAAQRLGRLERAYRERYIPPPSREHPYPGPDEARRAKRVHELETSCAELASGLLTAETPANDGIWSRVRDEAQTLRTLLTADIRIVTAVQQLVPAIDALDAASVQAEEPLDAIAHLLTALGDAVTARRASLTI